MPEGQKRRGELNSEQKSLGTKDTALQVQVWV